MRIVAGSRKGARIFSTKGLDTRPTGDRVREAAFNLIGPVDGASVLDLLAGARVVYADVLRFLASDRGRYDLVLVDPPYEMVESLQMRLGPYLSSVLAEGGLLVFETSAKIEPELPLTKRTSRRYGAARLTLFQH